MVTCGKSIPGRGNIQCKGLRSKEANLTGAQWDQECSGVQTTWGLRDFRFHKCNGQLLEGFEQESDMTYGSLE